VTYESWTSDREAIVRRTDRLRRLRLRHASEAEYMIYTQLPLLLLSFKWLSFLRVTLGLLDPKTKVPGTVAAGFSTALSLHLIFSIVLSVVVINNSTNITSGIL